jgi:hypothetical protein
MNRRGERTRPSLGMDVRQWGPNWWATLHTFAISRPLQLSAADRALAHTFVHAFARSLPCVKCRKDFRHVVERDVSSAASASLRTRDAFFRKTIDWHNEVNLRLGKPQWSYDAVYRRYAMPLEGVDAVPAGTWGARTVGIAVAVVLLGGAAVYRAARAPCAPRAAASGASAGRRRAKKA